MRSSELRSARLQQNNNNNNNNNDNNYNSNNSKQCKQEMFFSLGFSHVFAAGGLGLSAHTL